MANDNIIRFPDSSRGAAAGAIDPYLADARDLVARRLREAMRAFSEMVQQDLMQQADRSEEREQRKFLMDTRDKLMERANRLEALVAAQWQREFDAAACGKAATKAAVHGLEELSLVDDGELDEDLIVKAIGAKIREQADEALFGVERRVAHLTRRPGLGPDDHPAAPPVLGRALRGALHEAEFSGPERILLLQHLARGGADLAGIYRDLDSHLIGKNILPNLKRSYEREQGAAPARSPVAHGPAAFLPAAEGVPPAPQGGQFAPPMPEDVFGLLQRLVAPDAVVAAPGTTVAMAPVSGGGEPQAAVAGRIGSAPGPQVWAFLNTIQRRSAPAGTGPFSTQALREIKTSTAAEDLNPLDAITVDIVAMLFDLVFEDKEVPDPIKALVGRLQIPVLKVAMLDKTFFSSRAHPARRLLDGISRAAVRWGQSGTHEDPLYREVARIVERVQNEFAQDTNLFENLCVELEEFLANEDKAAEAWASRAAPLVAEREKREAAEAAAAQAVMAWRAKAVPETVRDLLEHEWKSLLAHFHFHDDEGGWVDAMRVGNDLVASVQSRTEAREIKALARKLPVLVRDVQTGFDRLGTLPARRFELIDSLFSIHAAILRGAEVVAAPKPAEPETPVPTDADAVLASRRLDDGELVVESLAIVGTQPPESLSETARRQVADMKRGDWVEFRHAEGNPRYRLSWVSPQRGVLLFTNPQSPRAIAVSPDALALQFEHGEAVPVSALPIFDRALDRALDTLKAA